MRTCQMLKALRAGLIGGLVTTAIAEGSLGFGRSIANLASSVPEDGEVCLAKMKHQRDVDVHSILWSLLAFVPGFVLGALYYLTKHTNLCNPSASDYEAIENDESEDSIREFLSGLVSAENSLLRGLQILLVTLASGLASTGVLYTPVKLGTDDVDRSVFLPEKCHTDLKYQNIGTLAMCLIPFVMIGGTVLFVSLHKASNNQNRVSPAQQEAGSTTVTRARPEATASLTNVTPAVQTLNAL